MKLKWLAPAFLCTGLVYCGGGKGGGGSGTSGVDPTKTVGELSSGEIRDLCEYFSTLEEQPERTIDCGNGLTTTVGVNPEDVQASIDQCVTEAPATCDATVADAEMCSEVVSNFTDDQMCDLFGGGILPAACIPLMSEDC